VRPGVLLALLAILTIVAFGASGSAGAINGTTIWTLAGDGVAADTGDGGQAREASINQPRSIFPLPGGGYVWAEPWSNRARMVDANGVITTLAGTGVAGDSGDNGPATQAELDFVHSVAPTADGGFLVADTLNSRIRKIDASGIIRTVAGTGSAGYSGDGGQATNAQINNPRGVVALPDGGFMFPDTNNHRVRRVSPTGIITTVAGTGTQGFSGDGGPATSANLSVPFGVAPTADGGFLVDDVGNQRVRKVSVSGTITTVAGTGVKGYSGDGGPATSAKLADPHNLVALSDGGFVIADASNQRVRLVSSSGVITTLAGNGVPAFSGDGGNSTSAQVSVPKAVGVTASGDVLVAEEQNNRIRFIGSVVAPASTTVPSVTGAALQGATLAATAGGWSGTGPVPAYSWERCSPGCTAIPGATGKTYTLGAADVGSTVRVTVTASNPSGSVSASSAKTATVAGAVLPPTNNAPPTISGTVAQGATLTVDEGSWSGATPITFTYRWSRCNTSGSSCSPIAGATAKTYTPVSADVGSTLRARVDASNAAGSSDYAARVDASGPLSYWRLGDGGGTAVDERAFANGSYVGGPAQGAASLLARESNPAVSFDGSSQYVDVPANPAWTGSTFSIELLVKPSVLPANKTIWSTMGPDFTGWWLNTNTNGVPRMFIGDGTAWRNDASASPLVAGTTYHLVATYDGSRARLYVNGALVSTGPAATMAPDVDGSVMRFGAYSTGPGQYWPGVLDDASFYPTVLSPAEVAAHYDASLYGSSAQSGATSVVAGTPPVNTALPSVTGTAQQGQTLTATTGTWTGAAPITYTRQWRRCNTGGSSCADISGATAATYALVAADVGSTLRVRVTATNAAGFAFVDSAATPVVVTAPAAPASTSVPVVSGTAASGQVLTTTDGTWTGTAPITYTRQWRRCDAAGAGCASIAGATAASYTLTAADVGSTIRARVTATNASGSATADSDPSDVVTSPPSPPVGTGLPVVSGSAQSGQSLSVSNGSWSGSTPMSFAYQWRRCDASGGGCVDIGGATSSSYGVVSGDVGSTLRAVVTASNGGGSGSATSAQTAVVVAGSSSGSMTFSVSAGGDDGDVTAEGPSSSGYPPVGQVFPNPSGSVMTAGRRFVFGNFQVMVPLLRFDTSALPDGATITSATLKVYVTRKTDGDDRSLMAEWLDASAWPIDAADFTLASSGSALAGSDVTGVSVGAVNSFALAGVSAVSTTGWTALRMHLSGGQPAGDNYVQMATSESSNPAPQLVVTYTTG
jgi:hypothetical protein